MALSWNRFLQLVGSLCICTTALTLPYRPSLNESDYPAEAIITTDVAVIGGGASGTYGAVRLRDLGQRVVLIEQQNRLGGHTNTYTDPVTNTTVDYGVVAYHQLDIVKEFFRRYDIPLSIVTYSSRLFGTTPQDVDFSTGKPVNVTNYDANMTAAAFTTWAAQLAKYPTIQYGFDIPDPVPADLLMPFGEFVDKYSLAPIVYPIFIASQGLGDLVNLPTLYVLKAFGLQALLDSSIGYLTTANQDNSAVYEAARAELGANALLSSTVILANRRESGGVVLLVQTPSGLRLVKAKKLLVTMPPKLSNLVGWDLDSNERALFGQFHNTTYYAGLLHTNSVLDNVTLDGRSVGNAFDLPKLPNVLTTWPTRFPGIQHVVYSSATPISEEQAKANIITSIHRLRTAGTLQVDPPKFAAFASHTPFELMVSAEAIKSGFYRRLYALQGRQNTYYSGGAFHVYDSTLLWNFTEALLPSIVSSINLG